MSTITLKRLEVAEAKSYADRTTPKKPQGFKNPVGYKERKANNLDNRRRFENARDIAREARAVRRDENLQMLKMLHAGIPACDPPLRLE